MGERTAGHAGRRWEARSMRLLTATAPSIKLTVYFTAGHLSISALFPERGGFMRHWKRSGFVGEALCTLFLCAFLAGCGGGSHSVAIGPVVTISLAPVVVSLNAGDVLQLQVSALDANKRSVFNQTITFTSSNPGIQVSNTGLLCAGTWDSLTTPINCKAATPPATTTVTASAQGKTSNVVPVNVHLPITSLTAIPSSNLCVSQGGAVTYTARALNVSTDITSTVGAFAWSIDSSSVGSLANVTTLGSAAATNTATAKLPGVTQVHVSANNANIVTGI